MEIFKWLNDASLVVSYTIHDFRQSDTAFYLSLKCHLLDGSVLQVREYVDPHHRKYSFHWQAATGGLISRWDNAPHFPNLLTFPHHIHLATGDVIDSYDIAFDDVMRFIQEQLVS